LPRAASQLAALQFGYGFFIATLSFSRQKKIALSLSGSER
jgi:hypothetical protein